MKRQIKSQGSKIIIKKITWKTWKTYLTQAANKKTLKLNLCAVNAETTVDDDGGGCCW